MKTYIALFRGINRSGETNVLPMKDLVAQLEYLASQNAKRLV